MALGNAQQACQYRFIDLFRRKHGMEGIWKIRRREIRDALMNAIYDMYEEIVAQGFKPDTMLIPAAEWEILSSWPEGTQTGSASEGSTDWQKYNYTEWSLVSQPADTHANISWSQSSESTAYQPYYEIDYEPPS